MNPSESNSKRSLVLQVSPTALANLMAPPAPVPIRPSASLAELPTIDFRGMIRALRRKWRWIVASGLVCGGLAAAYAFSAPKIYEVQATLEVEQEPTKVLAGAGFGASDVRALEILKTLEQKILNQGMLLRVVKAEKLDADPGFAKPRPTPYNDDELVALLAKKVTSKLERGTRLIHIKVEDPSPERAKRIADRFLIEATRVSTEANSSAAKEVKKSLEAEKEKALRQLHAAEQAAAKFRAEHAEMPLEESPSDVKSNVYEDRLKAIGAELTAVRAQRVALENAERQVAAAKALGVQELLKIPAIAQLDEVVSIQKKITDKRAEIAKDQAVHGPKHHNYLRLRSELDVLLTSLSNATQTIAAGFQTRLKAARDNEAKLETEFASAKAELGRFKTIAGEFEVFARELKAQREHYSQLLARLKEAEVSQDFSGSILRVSDEPMLPTHPAKPKKVLLTVGGSVLGIALGMALVLLWRLLDRTVRDLTQGEKELGLPGLAAVPLLTLKNAGRVPLLNSPEVRPESAEAFRAMRASLALLGKGLLARSFLFTSSQAGDGKSSCAMNYAVALAQQGYRTLLIDADMRKPVLDDVFIGARNPCGLANHLNGEDTGNGKACVRTDVENLYLFSAGISSGTHPAELLSSETFAELVQESLKWFHKVVIDTPPVNAVTDALLMARAADSTILVVRSGKTTIGEARRALNKIAMSGGTPVGFVLNAAAPDALAEGYTGSYAYAPPTTAPLALPAPAAS